MYTQYGGIRPFGTGLLIAGVSPVPRLFETGPSGALVEYMAVMDDEGYRKLKGGGKSVYERNYGVREGGMMG